MNKQNQLKKQIPIKNKNNEDIKTKQRTTREPVTDKNNLVDKYYKGGLVGILHYFRLE